MSRTSPETGSTTPAWTQVADALAALARLVGPGDDVPAALQEVGAAYSRLAAAYAAAVVASGRTSLRAAAAARALDLRTPRSALEAFLGRTP